jgi:hypothetical protein
MWRRVPCEQPLHTGQSILSPRRNPMLMVAGCFDRSRSALKAAHFLGASHTDETGGPRRSSLLLELAQKFAQPRNLKVSY